MLLKNVNVVLPDRELTGSSVLVENSKIVAIGSDARSSLGRELDLEGATLMPGFIDVHFHGAVGVDVMEATPDDLRKVSA